jgi:heterodisulfide reductase subunit B
MAEKLKLFLTNTDFNKLVSGEISIQVFLPALFEDKQAYAQMCNSLKEYHRNDGGSPEVHDFDVINSSFNPQTLTGHFRCTFKVIYHYTCSDVRNNAADTIDWDFKIDAVNEILHLTGEETLERDTDEF